MSTPHRSVTAAVRAATAHAPDAAQPLVASALLVAAALDDVHVTERGLVELSRELRNLLAAIERQTPVADSELDGILSRISAREFAQ